MRRLIQAYGHGLTALFVSVTALWGVLLIILPQVSMLDSALRTPLRQLDSSIAYAVGQDAHTCRTVLESYRDDTGADQDGGGLAIPSITPSPSPSPSPSIMAAPSPGGSGLPYIIQCDRATTHQMLARDEGEQAWLDLEYGIATLAVDGSADLETQLAQAQAVQDAAEALRAQLLQAEASASSHGLANFAFIFEPRAIPLTEEAKARADAEFGSQLQEWIGLRFERDGTVYERITLTTLMRTILFAVLATGLALIACYPIAYNLALVATPQRAVWLFLALIIPYATVELMRIYAWVALIDANGVFNQILDWLGVLDLAADEAIAFKRSPITVFVVIVYTYILFMVFPLYNVMATLDRNQIEAAHDLGASTWRIHRRIIVPHAKPGIAVGCIATFMLSAGAFSVPRIISRGLQGEWFSQTIYNKFFESQNSNLGSAYAFAYMFICFAIVGVFMWAVRARLKDFVRA
ncbi:MAG: ABC transporter permease [Alphaproteobacteria bacterium]